MDWNEKGREALDSGEFEAAVECFEKATTEQPDWSVPFYNLGLAHKFLHNWAPSLEANYRAHQLNPEDDAAVWNLAMAAVAVGDWDKAAIAFKRIGLTIPETPPPWDFRMGLIPIRVNPSEHPEVVWCDRLDPVRAMIRNIPLPQCERRYGDIVLNDGAPNGYRQLGEREVPVFDELEVLEASDYSTYEIELDPSGLNNLLTLLEEYELPAENWTTSLRYLCRACSEGRPHDDHDQELENNEFARIGVAVKEESHLGNALERWTGNVHGYKRVF